ncbi:MAG: hypothetical protein O7H41_18900 [Planctomycetota bacterium]|nr:hypothetical protein [Planctomycetota bacterium]
MAKRNKLAIGFPIAGCLFAISGVGWIMSGNTAIGMMNISIGMMFIVLGIVQGRKAVDPDSAGDANPPTSDGSGFG